MGVPTKRNLFGWGKKKSGGTRYKIVRDGRAMHSGDYTRAEAQKILRDARKRGSGGMTGVRIVKANPGGVPKKRNLFGWGDKKKDERFEIVDDSGRQLLPGTYTKTEARKLIREHGWSFGGHKSNPGRMIANPVKMRKAPKGWIKAKAVRVVRRGGKRIVEVRR